MRPYVSIDIETTGLDSDTCQILEVGAVIDNWVSPIHLLPTFHAYIDHDIIVGEPYALCMNQKLLDVLTQPLVTKTHIFELAEEFLAWLNMNGIYPTKRHVLFAGKNYATFDREFLKHVPNWNELILSTHRTIDPAMLYYEPKTDDGPPNMAECLSRANINKEVEHEALSDAYLVVELIRAHYAP
jgi:oligoribonuclease (3'-5' exoribonuclease)